MVACSTIVLLLATTVTAAAEQPPADSPIPSILEGTPIGPPWQGPPLPPPAPAPPPPPPSADGPVESKVQGPLGPSWDVSEYVLWWVAPQPLPPLLVRSRTAAVPILGAPGSTTAIGGQLDSQEHSGGRFVTGWA